MRICTVECREGRLADTISEYREAGWVLLLIREHTYRLGSYPMPCYLTVWEKDEDGDNIHYGIPDLCSEK